MNDYRLAVAQSVKSKYRDYFLSLPGVHTIMTTIINGAPAILIRSDSRIVLPASVEGIPIYASVSQRPVSLNTRQLIQPTELSRTGGILPRTFYLRPVHSGMQISTEVGYNSGCTLGIVLHKDNDRYLVSAAHGIVMGLDLPICQPYDYKAGTGRIAKLSGYDLQRDIAWAKITSIDLVSDHIYELKSVGAMLLLEDSLDLPAIGSTVCKSGSTTGVTYGTILSTDADFTKIDADGNDIIMTDMICVFKEASMGLPLQDSTFGFYGDSGSAIIDNICGIIGILHTGYWEWEEDSRIVRTFAYATKTKYLLGSIGSGFSYRKHVGAEIEEPKISYYPYNAPQPISPGSLDYPGTTIDTVFPLLKWQPVSVDDWEPHGWYSTEVSIEQEPDFFATVFGVGMSGERNDTEIVAHGHGLDKTGLYYDTQYSWTTVVGNMPFKDGPIIMGPRSPMMFFRTPIPWAINVRGIPVETMEPEQGFLGSGKLQSEMVLVDPLEHERGAIIGLVGKYSPGAISYIPPLGLHSVNRLAIHDFIADQFGIFMAGHWNETQPLHVVTVSARHFFQEVSNPIGVWDCLTVALSLAPYNEEPNEIVAISDLITGVIAAKIFQYAFEIKWPWWYDGDPTMGDVDDDGIRSYADEKIIMQYFLGRPISEISPLPEAEFLRRADMDKNGMIDVGDIIALRWLIYWG